MTVHAGYATVDLLDLTPFPGNPRVGDLAEIKKSLARFGQYRTVVVWHTEGRRFIVAGNHTRQAMLELSQMDPVSYEREYGETAHAFDGTCRIELGEFNGWDEARRVNAADNRLAELGSYDDEALAALLETFGSDWAGTGWGPEDLAALKPDFGPDGGTPPPLDKLEPRLCQRCGYDVANNPDGLGGE